MKRIYIVRHGQTYINRYDKMQGWCDTPLTDEGIQGAKDAGKALSEVPFDIAISSSIAWHPHTKTNHGLKPKYQ